MEYDSDQLNAKYESQVYESNLVSISTEEKDSYREYDSH